MAFLWNENLAIGNELVDNQHKEIFERVNKLLFAMAQGKGRNELGKLIVFLEDYIVKHFNAEEELMSRHFYPGYTQQRNAHAQFIKDFSVLKKEFETQGTSSYLVIQVQRKVCDWLVNHISMADKGIGDFLKTKI